MPGINIVTRLGLVFALVVVYTLFSFYFGLFTVGQACEFYALLKQKTFAVISM